MIADMGTKREVIRIPARTIKRVLALFERAYAVHKNEDDLRMNGRVLSAEAVTNAIVLHFLDLPEAEQRQLLARYVPRFAAMKADDEAAVIKGKVVRPHLAGEEDEEKLA